MIQKLNYALLTIALLTPFCALNAHADPSDGQIAGILTSINNGEIKISAASIGHTTTTAILRYAAGTGADHVKSNADITAWSVKSGIKIETSPTSDQYEQAATASVNQLNGLSGSAFDHQFLQNEVTSQQAALTAINQLVFFVHNPDLVALMQKLAPVVNDHIHTAQQMQAPVPAIQ